MEPKQPTHDYSLLLDAGYSFPVLRFLWQPPLHLKQLAPPRQYYSAADRLPRKGCHARRLRGRWGGVGGCPMQ